MAQFTYSSLDIVGLIFLMLALAALLWSFRGKALSLNDREASRVLLDSHGDENTAAVLEDRRRVRVGGPILLTVFVVMIVLMTLAPLITIVIANRATSSSAMHTAPGLDP